MNKYQDFKHRRLSYTQSSFSKQISPVFLDSPKALHEFDIHNRLTPADQSNLIPLKSFDSTDRLIKHQSISDLSAKQNDICNKIISGSPSSYSHIFRFPEVQSKMPTEHDFRKIIQGLNEVTKPREVPNIHQILDSSTVNIKILEGKSQYLHVYVKGKKPPLALKIQKNKGKFIIYSSLTSRQPNSENYEKLYASEYIEIREPSLRFQYDFVYFSIKALENSELIVFVSFGKNINSLAELKKIKRSLNPIDFFYNDRDYEMKEQKKSAKSNGKDFIQNNKKLKPNDINSKIIKLTERAEIWKNKREEVVERKKDFMLKKKQKSLIFVNRNQIKKEQEKARLEKLALREINKHKEEFWMRLLVFCTSVSYIKDFVNEVKNNKISHETFVRKVRLIQNTFRSFEGTTVKEELSLIRCRNLLNIYHAHIKALQQKFISEKSVFSIISFFAYTGKIFSHFSKFQTNVKKIQKCVKGYFCYKKSRILMLKKMWNSACENMIFKNSLKKVDITKEIFAIPATYRDQVLLDYFYYKLKIRRNQLDLLKEDAKKLLDYDNQGDFNGFCSRLEGSGFFPSMAQMEAMIESAMIQLNNKIFENTEI